MQPSRISRVFLALACVAVLLASTATSTPAAHPDLAAPVLVFCFFAIVRLAQRTAPDASPLSQSLSLLTVRITRAPPVA